MIILMILKLRDDFRGILIQACLAKPAQGIYMEKDVRFQADRLPDIRLMGTTLFVHKLRAHPHEPRIEESFIRMLSLRRGSKPKEDAVDG